MKNSIDEVLSALIAQTKAIFDEKLHSVILFGSYARGDYDSESDIDILVIADVSAAEIGAYRSAVDSMCGALLYEFGFVVSVIEKDSETYNRYKTKLPFYMNIEAEGKRIA